LLATKAGLIIANHLVHLKDYTTHENVNLYRK
jgi:hypothetical protein